MTRKKRPVDLNLFAVFDTIYTERNLTRAADVLHITQPAVSNALKRLRNSLNDELFVRTPQGMTPTPVAESLIHPVRQALAILNDSVQSTNTFNAAQTQRTFRISMTDMAESQVLPALLDHLQQTAPGITVSSYPCSRRDVARDLATGQLDFAIDVPLIDDPNMCHTPLATAPYVCAVRPGHPHVGSNMTLDEYLTLYHIHISSRPTGHGQIDLALNRLGRQRNIQLRVSHYLVAPLIVERTNLAMTVPSVVTDNSGLRIFKLPFKAPKLDWHLYWHKRVDQDQANRWMRRCLTRLFR